MQCSKRLGPFLLLLLCAFAFAKDKKKAPLPPDILQARTVLVVVDPHAGGDAQAPIANQRALKDVERALATWGRFQPATDISTADLVITIRKGSGNAAQPANSGFPANNNSVAPPPGGGPAGSDRMGGPRVYGDPTVTHPEDAGPQSEFAPAEDTFTVYRGKSANALHSHAVWRYSAKNALESPGVPAVDQFRQALLETEKQQQETEKPNRQRHNAPGAACRACDASCPDLYGSICAD